MKSDKDLQQANAEQASQTAGLLLWYDENRRILPWREDPTPYHVWLSEIMLQQTRVETAIDYYHRFLAELPDVASLASASEDQYMKLWEGLGYYSRIRNMHKAAVMIVEEYNGKIPGTAKELIKLPGIGEYTAAAIASIAFGERISSIDGNLLRVFARMCGWDQDIKAPASTKAALSYYDKLLPGDRPGDFNQALMDLGATICLPNGMPLCDRCPWEGLCVARKEGRELELPILPAKQKRTIDKRTILLIHDETRILIRKRPDSGLLAGLYEYPGLEGHWTKSEVEKHIKEIFPSSGDQPAPSSALQFDLKKEKSAKHVFSHREWRMICYDISLSSSDLTRLAEQASWFPATTEELENTYSLPSAFSYWGR